MTINAELTEMLLQQTFISIASKILPFEAVISLIFVIALSILFFARNAISIIGSFKCNFKNWIITYVLLIISILSLSGVSGFLYTNF